MKNGKIRYIYVSALIILELVMYVCYSIQMYELDINLTLLAYILSISALYITYRMFKIRDVFIRVSALFHTFIYTAVVERLFILLRYVTSMDLFLVYGLLIFGTINIIMLLITVMKGREDKIIKMDYMGYA